MPPAANPNPDRASCASSVAPAAEAKDELVPEPLLPVRAPAAAPIVASAAPAGLLQRRLLSWVVVMSVRSWVVCFWV